MLKDICDPDRRARRSPDLGLKLENLTIKDLGRAKRVKVDKDNSTIVDGAGKKRTSTRASKQIRAQVADTSSDYDREKLQSGWRSSSVALR